MKPSNVAVVIPVYRPEPTAFEAISLRQCQRMLPSRAKYLVAPDGLDLRAYAPLVSAEPSQFPERYFRSIDGYNDLLLHRSFYTRFAQYQYILIFQPDAFVFRDELDDWCSLGYSYIGAPWRAGYDNPLPGAPFIGVGNGGFSLRRIADFMAVFDFAQSTAAPKALAGALFRGDLALARSLLRLVRELVPLPRRRRKVFEDVVFGQIATGCNIGFTVPSAELATRFSIETLPSETVAAAGGQLPFGCHAWWRYDLEFWAPHIEAFAHKLPEPVELMQGRYRQLGAIS